MMEKARVQEMLQRMRYLFVLVALFAIPASLLRSEEPQPPPEPAPEQQPPEPVPGGDELEGEGRGRNTEGWEAYVEFVPGSIKYLPPSEAGGAQAIEFKCNLVPDVPKGAKVKFILEYNGLEMDTLDYTLKDENRKNLTITWKPKQRLATGEYFFRVKMPLKEQTSAVQRLIQGKSKRFPAANEPWSWYYGDKKDTVVIGSPEDEEAEKKMICDVYSDFITRLIESMTGFVKKMEQVKAGKELASGDAVDIPKFKAYVAEWRKKQGALQREIFEFQLKEPALHMKSQTAFAYVLELGRMVSKRGWQVQKEVTDHYKVNEVINPAAEGFDRNYKRAVTKESLNQMLERIDELVCPRTGAEPEEGAAGAGAQEKPAGEDSKEAEVQPEAGEDEKGAEESKPKKDETKPAKKPAKKTTKKSTSKSTSSK